MTDLRLVPAGESALVAECADRIDVDVNARVRALAAALERDRLPGVRDIVPTIRSVAVYFDPLRTDVRRLTERIHAAASMPASEVEGVLVEIPVCYDGDCAPDLDHVARASGMTRDEVVHLHTAREYRVFMLGFIPGFAYLGTVDPRLAMPRRATPRLDVPEGAVGIAGLLTGVYPRAVPGGWNIVGRTAERMFRFERAEPSRLRAGDRVRFSAVDRDTFEGLMASRDTPS
jgi:KipI family sensor histidine kinase inhibitor